LQISSGTILKPYSTVDGITSSGTTASVTTKEQHNLAPGTQILIEGANEAAYNGSFVVDEVTSFTSFTYIMAESAASPATGIINLNVDNSSQNNSSNGGNTHTIIREVEKPASQTSPSKPKKEEEYSW
jgi:hypothetical protein